MKIIMMGSFHVLSRPSDLIEGGIDPDAAHLPPGKSVYPFTRAEKIGNVAVLEAIARSAETGEAVLVSTVG